MSDIVQKLWGFCHTLRHDGIDYGDYIEQITYLLFIKMAGERDIELPSGCNWSDLARKSGTALTNDYIDILRTLGNQTGYRSAVAFHQSGKPKKADWPH